MLQHPVLGVHEHSTGFELADGTAYRQRRTILLAPAQTSMSQAGRGWAEIERSAGSRTEQVMIADLISQREDKNEA